MVLVYYCPDHPSNRISPGSLKCYSGIKNVSSDPIEDCDFVYPQFFYWGSTYHTWKNIDYLEIKIVKVNPQRNRYIVVTTVCFLLKQNLFQIIYHTFGHVSITRLGRMARIEVMKGLPTNIPDLE